MKKCVSCANLVKNGYHQCYECNNKKQDNDSGSETPPIYKKESIPKTVRNCLWINYFGTSRIGICACCRREPITINNFHASHIHAEREGGKTSLDNMAPCCVQCNLSTVQGTVITYAPETSHRNSMQPTRRKTPFPPFSS